MALSPQNAASAIREGVLAFPASPFGADGALDEKHFEAHVAELAGYGPAALVPAAGAGEFFSLDMEEHARLLKGAVGAAGALPVIAAAGFSGAIAAQMARAAEAAGASAVLLFPPYLAKSEQAGLAAYVEQVCAATGLGVILYSRDNGVATPDTALRLADRCANFIALKDGVGEFGALGDLCARAGDRLVVVNGVPTAEMIARACFALGVRSYSSAVFTFAPRLAMRYFRALRDGDAATSLEIFRDFYVPLSAIRSRKAGYAVSIVKAGLRTAGRSAGAVRPPLVDLTEAEEHELGALVERACRAGGHAAY